MAKRVVGWVGLVRSQWWAGSARLSLLVLAVAVPLLVASGCGGGQSEADKAKSEACDAKSDIATQIDTLKGLPLSESSVDTAKTALQAIDADLQTIENALPTLEGSLKTELQDANATFKTQVQQAEQSVTSAQSVPDAVQAAGAAVTALATSYEQAFANVEC
jgi:hypothetical protein